ncbi:GroES-like protein [Periconia macrospinosa]|uniref:GroES-like protein n=1 Tax=Periconia macrospinosa TaxID=97972 RepID=A0A2V1DUK8_9PLEO|nr:GroES-like protein [Periconia macrospinosa]
MAATAKTTTQKALLVTSINSPLTLSTTHPIPTPKPTQLLLRVTLTGLNHHDQKIRDRGLWFANSLPTPLGTDIVGYVERVGSAVTQFAPGDHVFTYGNLFEEGHVSNGLQEFAIADAAYTARVPEGYTEEEVASVPVNFAAAYTALFDPEGGLGVPTPGSSDDVDEFGRRALLKEETILIVGGGSNCGRYLVQLASISGFGKIVVLGGNEDELKGFGATHVLDRHGDYDTVVRPRIAAAVGGDLLYAVDAVNMPDTLYVTINALSEERKGMVARLLPSGPHATEKVVKEEGSYTVVDTTGVPQFRKVGVKMWVHISEFLEERRVKTLGFELVDGVGLDAERVNEVLDGLRDGKRSGQALVRVAE